MLNFTDTMKEAMDHISKAQRLFAGGPLDYYLKKLVHHSESLMKFAKYKVGDVAVLKHDVPCKGGWAGSEKHLCKGTEGLIEEVDYDNGFVYAFVPDKQFWRDRDGEYHIKDRKHSYGLRQKWFED